MQSIFRAERSFCCTAEPVQVDFLMWKAKHKNRRRPEMISTKYVGNLKGIPAGGDLFFGIVLLLDKRNHQNYFAREPLRQVGIAGIQFHWASKPDIHLQKKTNKPTPSNTPSAYPGLRFLIVILDPSMRDMMRLV